MQEATIWFNKQGYVQAVVRGVLDLDAIRRYTASIVPLGERHNCKRLLTDLREAESRVLASELHTLLFMSAEKGLDRSWRQAIAVKERTPILDIFEEIARERLFPVRSFADIEKAITWLTE